MRLAPMPVDHSVSLFSPPMTTLPEYEIHAIRYATRDLRPKIVIACLARPREGERH